GGQVGRERRAGCFGRLLQCWGGSTRNIRRLPASGQICVPLQMECPACRSRTAGSTCCSMTLRHRSTSRGRRCLHLLCTSPCDAGGCHTSTFPRRYGLGVL